MAALSIIDLVSLVRRWRVIRGCPHGFAARE
jgi:hypothetical protein